MSPCRFAAIPVASVVFIVAAAVNASAAEYRDENLHYTLELPSGWQLMSSMELGELNKLVAERLPGKNINYVAGFRPLNSQSHSYPYILVQSQASKMSGASYADIERAFSQEMQGTVKEVKGSLADISKNISVGGTVVDRSRNWVITRLQMDVANVGTVQGYSVGHIGSDGVLLIHSYAQDREFQTWLPTFNQLNESFHFNPEYTFIPGSGSSAWSEGQKYGIIGGVVGGIVGALGYLSRKKNKPKTEKPGTA